MSPSELLTDNLTCIYNSGRVDVATKRRHRAWLQDFVNVVMLAEGAAETTRMSVASTVSNFYGSGDSPLFGKIAVSRESPKASRPALSAPDIRAVLNSLSLTTRTPLLLVWQSGCEINRVLSLRWGDLANMDKSECPLKFSFPGRKRHRKAYHTYIGKDGVDGLRAWRAKSQELTGRVPGPTDLVFVRGNGRGLDSRSLGANFRKTALRLHGERLILTAEALGDLPSCW
jgi:integrase